MNVPQMLESLIPLAGGALLLRQATTQTAADPGRRKRWRWLGAAVALIGFAGVLHGALADRPPPDARAIAEGMRAKLSLPRMVDGVTRLDAIDAVGQHIVMRHTVTAPPASEDLREATMAELRRQLRGQVCGDANRRKLLQAGLGLEFEYTMGARTYPAIVVVNADCG